jgi:hypothetical protein
MHILSVILGSAGTFLPDFAINPYHFGKYEVSISFSDRVTDTSISGSE